MQETEAMTAMETKKTRRPKKMQKKKKKKEREKGKLDKKGGKELRQVGVPKVAQLRTKIAQGRRRTSRGQWNGGFTEDRRQGS